MAFSKKARRSRRRYRRRGFGRKRYRRRYRRRRYRRSKGSTEVKSNLALQTYRTTVLHQSLNQDNYAYLNIYAAQMFVIGTPVMINNCSMYISPGYMQNERIGNKIKPIKLRLTGCVSCTLQTENITDAAARQPNFWQVRLMVYQVRGGNGAIPPTQDGYHPLGLIPHDNNGHLKPSQIKKLLSYWQGSDYENRPYTMDDWQLNQGLGKMPLRRGIGGMMRMLYNKTFWVSGTKPCKQFRIVTRVPRPLVWAEIDNGEISNTMQSTARNCIYCVWIYWPGNYYSQLCNGISINCQYELFYTDK